ncbi:MAG: S8 family peptidase [Arcticibacter sp.]
MPEFPHLLLKRKINGLYQFTGVPIDKKIDAQTAANLSNRAGHGAALTASASGWQQAYTQQLLQRKEAGLPDIFSETVLPVFLQVDPRDFDIEALKGYGIEIVAEEENGFIIGANVDSFSSLGNKIQQFIDQKGKSKDQAAKLWQIVQGDQWRADYILSPGLKQLFPDGMADGQLFTVDISVACYLKMPSKPIRVMPETDEEYAENKANYEAKNKDNPEKKEYRSIRKPDSDEQYQRKLDDWLKRTQAAEIERDNIASERQDFLTNFIEKVYKGELLSSFVDLEDSFGFKAKMNGQALKDLIRNYAYVFEITEGEEIQMEELASDFAFPAVDITPPEKDSPIICVIDSGIQEKHLYLEPAILTTYSKNYVPDEDTTADHVPDGGHGTKVAGSILFGNTIPDDGAYQPPCFLVNARILDAHNRLSDRLFPAELMEEIADDFDGIRLFNMSVATSGPCRLNHISTWAAKLDSLIHQRKLLFILAAGNLKISTGLAERPGVLEHITAGRDYPRYLLESSCRIANPAQSLLSLTVGSVCNADFEDQDRKSFGTRGRLSAFSRTGPGLWGCIKPDVVEYGGDLLREKTGFLVTQDDSVSVKVIKTGANATGYAIGTSFAAPKVAHIIAHLAKRFPTESTLLYKALVVQSARLPEHAFHQPNRNTMRAFGFGIPDLQRAVENTPYRITFTTEGKVAAHQANLYSINVPSELTRAGDDYDILLEVTLVYTAEPRRTRKRLKSYFGSWLTWESSKLGESFDDFADRVLKRMEEETDDENTLQQDVNSIKWVVSTSPGYGQVKGMKRQDSATQKDWVILKSNVLTAELSFAVVGHKGWDKGTDIEIPFALVISFEAISKENEIYNKIEVANRVEVEEAIAISIPAASFGLINE